MWAKIQRFRDACRSDPVHLLFFILGFWFHMLVMYLQERF